MEASRYGITGTEAGVSRADQVLEIVADRTYGLMDMDQVDMDTLVYESFADIGKPEPFTDQDGNPAQRRRTVRRHERQRPVGRGHGRGGARGSSDVVVYRLTYAWGIVTPVMRDFVGDSVTPRRCLQHRRPQRAVLRRTAHASPACPAPGATHRGFSAAEFGLLLPILLDVQRRHHRVQPGRSSSHRSCRAARSSSPTSRRATRH